MVTNDELKRLMSEIPLTQALVADCLDTSVDTVKGWCAKSAKRKRSMHANTLKLLKLELRERGLLTDAEPNPNSQNGQGR